MQKTEFAGAAPQPKAQEQPRVESCKTCRYAHDTGLPVQRAGQTSLQCHRRPPFAQTIMVPTPDGGLHNAGSISTFPPVMPNEWCGEWTPAPKSVQ